MPSWKDYWRYLTNPGDMDRDTRWGSYAAWGTAGVALSGVTVVVALEGAGLASMSVGVGEYLGSTHVAFEVGGTWYSGLGVTGKVATYGMVGGIGEMGGLFGMSSPIIISGIPIVNSAGAATLGGTFGSCFWAALEAFLNGWRGP